MDSVSLKPITRIGKEDAKQFPEVDGFNCSVELI